MIAKLFSDRRRFVFPRIIPPTSHLEPKGANLWLVLSLKAVWFPYFLENPFVNG